MGFDIRPSIRRAFRLALRRPHLTAADVDDEIRFHIQSRIDQLVARGLTREQAAAEARRRFGLSWDDAVARVHEAGHEREERLAMTERLDAAWRDLTYAARTLRREPAFAIVVAVTFALGIGANATMFGVIDRLLLRPPPHVTRAEQLLELGRTYTMGGAERVMTHMPYPLFAELRRDTTIFDAVAAGSFVSQLTLGTGPTAEQVYGVFASSNYFHALGTRPALGRFFDPAAADESTPADVVVVSYGFWQREFGGDRDVLGKMLRLGRRDYAVIGVAPESFTGVDPKRVDVWIPLAHAGTFGMATRSWATHWGNSWLRVLARLRQDVSTVAVADRAGSMYERGFSEWSGRQPPKGPGDGRFVLRSILPSAQLADNPEARVARLLLAVSALVLIIACANVAGLLLARGTDRRREIAVRLALGVSRARLLRLLVGEALVLAFAGGVLALGVAHWGLRLLQTTLLSDFAWTESALDARVLIATLALAVLTALLAGLTPAIRTSRPNVVASLKMGGRGASAALPRSRAALIVVQAALSVVLAVGAGVFVQSLRKAATVRLGYETGSVLTAAMDVNSLGYDTPASNAVYGAMRDRIAQIPGVATVTVSSTHPLLPWRTGLRLRVPGRDSMPQPPNGGPYSNAVGADYFATLGLRIVEGRPITASDVSSGARVAVMTEPMARAYWPGERAVDRCVVLGSDSACTIIVGVAADARETVKGGDPLFLLYVPISASRSAGINTLLIRIREGDPARLVAPIRRAMQTAAPNLPYADVQAMDDLLAPQIRPWRMGAILFSLFGALALLISAIGLYSALAYTVTQRRLELGIRSALGAQVGDVVRLVMGQGIRAAVAGVIVGLATALVAGRFVADLLFETSPRNPIVLGAVATLLLAVSAVASFIPAWRASHVDPAAALRAD